MRVKSSLKQTPSLFRHPVTALAEHRWLRLLGWLMVSLLLVFGALSLLLRYVLLPQVSHYRTDIERALSGAIHLPVTISRIEGRMQGLRPRLELHGLTFKDESGRPALSFDKVIGIVGWNSLLKLSPNFYQLEIDAPVLAVRRDSEGHLFVAGLKLNATDQAPDISAWVLDQDSVVIRDARVTWTDEMRGAPPLVLDHLNLQLENTFIGHRFGLTAQPPPALASAIDLRGKFDGDSLADIEHWEGELYSQVDYADFAGWHAWVDYPVEVASGRGAARIWLDFAGSRPTAMTADLSLADVRIRLAPNLAMLNLSHMKGRIAVRKQGDGFAFSTRQLSLATQDGISLPPTDLSVERDSSGGNLTGDRIDLRALSSLAAHLPFPEDLRKQLVSYAPSGALDQFRFRWQGKHWPFARYNLHGRFSRLAIASVDNQPGLSGLGGTIDGDEKLGTLLLEGRKGTLSLPKVFHQRLAFDALDARVNWTRNGGHTELRMSQAQFHNEDATGVASGTYVTSDKGLGSIDLDARLSRAEGAAVWRYMPLQAGPNVGPFLQAALTQGKVSEATLKLKGNLDHFPFPDRGGVFRIHGVFHDAALRYAEDWPRIEGVAGNIEFDGPTMTINANEGSILGVRIRSARAVIPDLASNDEQVIVEGNTAGPTANFLKFIEASPVGEKIDHFTEDMRAKGNGELDLKLVLPLRRIGESEASGTYRFDDNRLLLDPDLPSLDNVRGHLEFSTESLSAKNVTAVMMGMPLKFDLKAREDGSLLAEVSGDASAAALRKQFGYAGLKNLAGGAHWSGTVAARKTSVEVRVSSDLVGMSSSLPEPFNKAASQAMPLLIERKAATAPQLGKKPRDSDNRSLLNLSLGDAMNAQLHYRQDGKRQVFERGLVSIGNVALRSPARGLTLAVSLPRINADQWRALLTDSDDKPPAAKAAPASNGTDDLMPDRIELRTAELQAAGRNFHDVRISAIRPDAAWVADVGSRELAAKLEWENGEGGGSDKLSGRITSFTMPEVAAKSAIASDTLKALPNLDLTLDHLELHGHDYGELHLAAENRGGDWNAKYSVRNDDGVLEGSGIWRLAKPPSMTSETQTDFKLNVRNIERYMNRIGYSNMVKRGKADINGKLAWKGAPQDYDLASLDGKFALDARDGQFNRLEPGVGRLLGILSLQSIQRRLTFDFRDIFSKGFAFDSVKGQMSVANGIIDTRNLEIRGPAATVQMAGSVDMNKETQDLKVRVQPALGESVATGALFVYPAVGATAWVFNKLFGNPLDKAFAYDFAVTGDWEDPKVEKIGAPPSAAAKPESGK